MKFDYVAASRDGKTSGTSSEFVAARLANRSIGMIIIAENGTSFGFSLSDGGQVKFSLKPGGGEVVYYAPNGK